MERPKIKGSQFALIVEDKATGHVYNTDLEISRGDQESIYFIFDSLEMTKEFILKLKGVSSTYGYVIYNENYELVSVLD